MYDTIQELVGPGTPCRRTGVGLGLSVGEAMVYDTIQESVLERLAGTQVWVWVWVWGRHWCMCMLVSSSFDAFLCVYVCKWKERGLFCSLGGYFCLCT